MIHQIDVYFCQNCMKLHKTVEHEPVQIYKTGFTYIRADDAKYHLGRCIKEEDTQGVS